MRHFAQPPSTPGQVLSGQVRVVDLGPEAGGARVGDTAVLFGAPDTGAASANEWGSAIGSQGDEIITRTAPRLTRAYECSDYQATRGSAPHVP